MALSQASILGCTVGRGPGRFLALQSLYRARDAGDPFRIAISDMQMPGMDGAALARVIKADEKLRDTRLVLFSGGGGRGDARRMQELGFDAYLTKPARSSETSGCLSAVSAGTVAANPLITRHTIREMRRSAFRILVAEDKKNLKRSFMLTFLSLFPACRLNEQNIWRRKEGKA